MTAERVALAPLLASAYELFDRIGAHDAFYVVIARASSCLLLTSDRAQARAAESLGVGVLYHEAMPPS